ncbi:hypothetical protein HBP39_04825 [Listeria welshimeri]|nr:hypothetical protein [Listeria welshimeri]MBC1938388.1 hypothetical protein [Listeria welshimeri]MBC1958321.1 hypothetical protein [Listeria welshimeri]MBC2351056.1 hypothetical protein [Listeria welshimeri]
MFPSGELERNYFFQIEEENDGYKGDSIFMDIMEYYYPIAYRMTVDYKTILKHIQSGLEIDSPHFQSWLLP